MFQIVCLEVSGLISVLLCPSLVSCYYRKLANLRSRPTNSNEPQFRIRLFHQSSLEHELFWTPPPQILLRLRVKSNNKTRHFTVY